MDPIFATHIKKLQPQLNLLLKMLPVTPEKLPFKMPLKGVYLFSKGKRHLYVGRSNNIRKRIGRHCRPVPQTVWRLSLSTLRERLPGIFRLHTRRVKGRVKRLWKIQHSLRPLLQLSSHSQNEPEIRWGNKTDTSGTSRNICGCGSQNTVQWFRQSLTLPTIVSCDGFQLRLNSDVRIDKDKKKALWQDYSINSNLHYVILGLRCGIVNGQK